MGDRWNAFVERMLPWYSPTVERMRDRRTAAIERRGVATRARAERVVADYRAASQDHSDASGTLDAAGDALIDEVRRGHGR